jgi:asparagine synthase (glutamine-hydrolysing)
LPEEICFRPKHGFNVPIDHWLKNGWHHMVEEAFNRDSALWKFGLIHKKSRDIAMRLLYDRERLNGHAIFSFIMLNLWLENVYGNHC